LLTLRESISRHCDSVDAIQHLRECRRKAVIGAERFKPVFTSAGVKRLKESQE